MKIAVLGGGNSGLAMCAFLSANGHIVNLWNRTLSNISEINSSHRVDCSGIIEGSYYINEVTDNIKLAIEDCNLIFVTVPASGHAYIANLLFYIVNENQTIILHPGRTFGGLEVLDIIKKNGEGALPKIAETQTIVFTCRKTSPSSVAILEIKHDVLISGINCSSEQIISKIPLCLRSYYKPVNSFLVTSLGNVGMILHVAPVLLNTGWIEYKGVKFKYYYSGITESIARLLEKLDAERLKVAEGYGVRIESIKDWLRRSYNVEGSSLYELIHNVESYKYIDAPDSLNHRYLYEDIPTGLVALEGAARLKGIKTPLVTMIIDLASEIMECNFRSCGRSVQLLKDYLK